jgi:tyrosine-specific transport protein
MHKTIGSIFLVAGTCIGLGLVGLPMVLASLGLIPSIATMLFIWSIMYYTSLVSVELNLQAGHGLALGALSRHFSGKKAEFIGVASLKLLMYTLLCAYINAGVSNIQTLFFPAAQARGATFIVIAALCSLTLILLLQLPIKLIDYANRMLFTGLLAIFSLLIIGLIFTTNWTAVPLFGDHMFELWAWRKAIPVLFTSFGFQVIFHTLTNYCNKNAPMLKQAFFWGSFIPTIVYVIWSSSVLTTLHTNAPAFYRDMAQGLVSDPGKLTLALSRIAQLPSIQILIWAITLLAIITSVIGVSVGLYDSINAMLQRSISQSSLRSLLAACITILPASIVILYIPDIFLSALAFAGMILVIIAILLPIYLLAQAQPQKLFYKELHCKPLLGLSVIAGLIIMGSELINMVSR